MTPTGTRLVSYLRVSTHQQAESGAGIDAQRAAIDAAALAHGWLIVGEHVDAGVSGKDARKRPALEAALADLEANRADGIVVSHATRIMRSLRHLLELAERFERRGWHLVILDLNVDTTTPTGRLMLSMLGALAQYERELISERTAAALAARKAAGVRLGKVPTEEGARMKARAHELKASGMGPVAIARVLTEEFGKGPEGGTIHYQKVQKMLKTPPRGN